MKRREHEMCRKQKKKKFPKHLAEQTGLVRNMLSFNL